MSWSRAASRTTGRPSADRVHRPQRVVPQVLAGDLVLGDPPLRGEVRRDRREQAGVAQQAEPDRRHRGAEQLAQLGCDPLAGQVGDQLGPGLDPGQRARFHPEAEGRRQPDRPDHPERVLLEPCPRVADGAQDAGTCIGQPVVRVHESGRLARPGAPGHGVDGEVAAREVELDGVAELDVVRPAEVGVVVVGPEGRDVEDRPVAPDADRAERVLVDRAGHELDDPLGQCVRGEIPVIRRSTEDDIAQRPADDVGRLSVRPERLEQGTDSRRDRASDGVRPTGRGRQLRPRNRYERHTSLRSSPRYGVNSE